jgi:hypothetical protein
MTFSHGSVTGATSASIQNKELVTLMSWSQAERLNTAILELLAENGVPGPIESHVTGHEDPQGSRTVYWTKPERETRLDLDALIEHVSEAYEITTAMGVEALRQAITNVQLLDKKQKDYGPANISAFGELGVLVRVSDKVERMRNLAKNGATPENEAVADSWVDLANYGLIGQLCNAGKWK